MLRKILAILFFSAAALVLIGSIANGSLMSNGGSAAAIGGAFTATLVAVFLYVLAGVFLFSFDGVCRKSRMEGYKLRGKQCTFITVFLTVFLAMMLIAMVGVATSDTDTFILSVILAALPYFVPMMIFFMFLAVYAIPYKNCRKRFHLDDVKLQAYLADDVAFTNLTADGSVQASTELLFFPRTFCIVPFAQIAAVKFYNALEQDIIFTLTDGKKLELVSSKKQFDAVLAAIEARKQ